MRKKIFSQKTSLSLTLLIMLMIVFILMLLARYSRSAQPFENKLSMIAWPLQEMVAVPSQAFKKIVNDLQSYDHLVIQNNQLQQDNFMLRVQLQRLTTVENQNNELNALLMSSKQIGDKVQVVRILAVDLSPNLQQMVVDAGSEDQAYKNQPVLDAFGVMGQLVSVQPKVSRLMLLIDPRSAIAVKDARSGVRAVAVGMRGDQLSLINVTDTADIQAGDLMVTSGLGLQFPMGYPVGLVEQVTHTPEQNFAHITVMPSAHLQKSDQVLLVWPKQQALADNVKDVLAISPVKSDGSHF